MNKSIQSLLDSIYLQAPKAGDSLQFDDQTLWRFIRGEQTPTAEQQRRLHGSPMTLRRYQRLQQQWRRAVAGWQGSQGLLLAAASDQPLSSLSTEDGRWVLHFLPGPGQSWRLVLKCQDDELAASLLSLERQVQVRDSGGNTLCQGRLDEDGELSASWPLEMPPQPHFEQIGGRFAVWPV